MIAGGDVSTADLYIGTVGSYLGAAADGKTPVIRNGFGVNPNDVLIMNDRAAIVLAAGTPDPWGYPGGSILDAGRVVSVPAGATTSRAPRSARTQCSPSSSCSTPGTPGLR